MPFAQIEGIKTHYQVSGEGAPLMLLAPMGFYPSVSHPWLNRIWRGFQPGELARDFRLIVYDRRESGRSGGRVEPLSWPVLARHARALLDYLEIEKAILLGGCVGCSVALALGAHYPERCRKLLLHWPVGGFRWLEKGRANFDRHIAFVRDHGLQSVAERARSSGLFWSDPEAGPWASVIESDAAFAKAYIEQDRDRYLEIAAQSRDHLFSAADPSGATSRQLMALNVPAFIMPGDDALHATSGAHVLRELMPQAKLSSLMPRQQNAGSVEKWIFASINENGAARPFLAA